MTREKENEQPKRDGPRVFQKGVRDAARAERAMFSFVIAAHPMLCIVGGVALGGILLGFGVSSIYATGAAYLLIFVVSSFLGRSRLLNAIKGRCDWLSVIGFGLVAGGIPTIAIIVARAFLVSLGSTVLKHADPVAPLALVVLVVLAPLTETFVTQGWLQTWAIQLAKHWSIPIAAIAFIIAHAESLSVEVIVLAFVFALLRQTTKSLGAVAIAHSVANGLVALAR